MSSPANKKLNKITQIVRLKHLMQRWRHRTPSAGTLAVYVGSERHRFIIPTRFLNLPVFLSLLNKAEEEFGFQTTGGLVIPCDVTFFKKLLKVLERDENGFSRVDLDEFMIMFDDMEMESQSTAHCKDLYNDHVNNRFTPLLQKARV